MGTRIPAVGEPVAARRVCVTVTPQGWIARSFVLFYVYVIFLYCALRVRVSYLKTHTHTNGAELFTRHPQDASSVSQPPPTAFRTNNRITANTRVEYSATIARIIRLHRIVPEHADDARSNWLHSEGSSGPAISVWSPRCAALANLLA